MSYSVHKQCWSRSGGKDFNYFWGKVEDSTSSESGMESRLAMPHPWPNMPVELTAHSVGVFVNFQLCFLWAATHQWRWATFHSPHGEVSI